MSQALRSKEAKPADSEHEAPVMRSGNGGADAERIAQLAYSYWEGRGCQGGSPEEDWCRAVEELNNGRTLTA